MINREVYAKEPRPNRILNQGVAEVAEEYGEDALTVLRYELETFICEGQYKKGLELVLGSYLQHLSSDAPVQKGVWISGFYGSGKSHLVKMLRILWTDFDFPDGASARGLVSLPDEIRDQLKELGAMSKRNGAGVFAAAGKMGGGGGESVRLIILGILFKAAGFPEQYAQARFLLWLRREGKLEDFKQRIAGSGKDLRAELGHLYVSTVIGKLLVDLFPDQFSTIDAAQERIAAQFSQPADISDDELVTAITDLLAVNGKIPLTLVVLDELQQYIGVDTRRSYNVQLVAETLSTHFRSRLLLVGTGQSALGDTANLQRLMARFPLPLQLSETDVDRVIRRNILVKKSAAEGSLRALLAGAEGEIARHLQGTALAHSGDDDKDLVSDYPMLPTRRRFWEHVLRSVDPTGTVAQLRNQLRIVDEAVLATAGLPVGTVVAGDFIFDQLSANLVSSQALSRESYTRITTLSASSKEEERLLARILKLAFLINKLPTEAAADTKLRATADSIVDLLVEKLEGDAEHLRRIVPGLLAKLTSSHDLMSIEGPAGTEYRLQTRESAEWYDDFRTHETKFKGNSSLVNVKRDERIKKWFDERRNSFAVRQGRSGTLRQAELHYGLQRPTDAAKKLTLWVRDGSATVEATALADARALKPEWPTVIAYLPDDLSSELFTAIVTMEAAKATIQGRGVPKTPQGEEAHRSILSRQETAEAEIGRCLELTMQRAKVWLSGGSEVTNAIGLAALVQLGLEAAAKRLYSKYDEGDKPGWDEVVKKAQRGDREALKAIGYADDPVREPVCSKVLDEIGAGMKGSEVRAKFAEAPYGWTQDAVDGALYTLLANDVITATDGANKAISYTAATLPRQKIGQTNFYREDEPLSMNERLALRGLFQDGGVSCEAGEESAGANAWIRELKAIAERAGGEAPLPARPETPLLLEVEGLMGNARLKQILRKRNELVSSLAAWTKRVALIEKRRGPWETLGSLVARLQGLLGSSEVIAEYQGIIEARRLLAEPDPVEPLIKKAAELLRQAINERVSTYRDKHHHLATVLESDPVWKRLPAEEGKALLAEAKIGDPAAVDVAGPTEILRALENRSLDAWDAQIAALPGRFEQAKQGAIKKLEPKVSAVTLPSRIIKTRDEAETWLGEARKLIEEGLAKGPVSV